MPGPPATSMTSELGTAGERPGVVESWVRGPHDARLIESEGGNTAGRFVTWLLVGVASLLLAVLAFDVAVDPYGGLGVGLFPTAITDDAAIKVHLIQQLHAPPHDVVLGSSRSLKIDPKQIRALTGHTAFNAGVRAGTPIETWALANYVHDRFPGAPMHFVWLVDVESFRSNQLDASLLNTAPLRGYFSAVDQLQARAGAIMPLLSWNAFKDSVRVVRAKVDGGTLRSSRFMANRPNGFLANGYHAVDGDLPPRGQWNKYLRIYRTGEFPRLRWRPLHYLEQTVAAMNSWGDRPLIILPPLQPELLKVLRPLGWTQRHAELLAELHRLGQTQRFDLLDLSTVRSFGGEPHGFFDGVHMRAGNAHRLIAAVHKMDPNGL